MNRSEQLHEEYEDALFALIMDKVAQAEGERLLEENDRLISDPAAAVPESFDQTCRETIRRGFAKRGGKKPRHSAGWVLRRVAVAAIILIALFMGAYAAIPEVRVGTLNLLIQTSDVASRLNMAGKASVDANKPEMTQRLMGYILPPLDKAFSLTDHVEDSRSGRIVYSDENGAQLRIQISLSSIHYVDEENTDTSESITIHGYEGKIIEKDNWASVIWTDIDSGYYIEITGTGVEKEWIWNLANGIEYVG